MVFGMLLFHFLLLGSEGIWVVDSPQPDGLGKETSASQH